MPAASLKSLNDDEHVDQHTCDFTCVVYIGKVDLRLFSYFCYILAI